MKKNYILFLLLTLFVWVGQAQTLTHSTSQTIEASNTVACPTETTNYLRVFDLANEFTITDEYQINSVEFGVEVSETGPITINLYTADGTDPTSATLTNIYSGTEPVTVTEENTVVSHTLTTAVILPANSILVFELEEAADGTIFRIGSNLDGQTAPSWLSSGTCGAGTVDSFGFTNHYVMNIVGNVLSIEDFSLDNSISIFPNPTSAIITIDTSNKIMVNSLELYNIVGKQVIKTVNVNSLDLSELGSGVYMLRVITDSGTLTKKVIRN